jgi:hypothetical protein
VLPKPPRLDVLLEESPLVLDVALELLEPLLLKPEPEPPPLLLVVLLDWFGWQGGEPGTDGPQFWATGGR